MFALVVGTRHAFFSVGGLESRTARVFSLACPWSRDVCLLMVGKAVGTEMHVYLHRLNMHLGHCDCIKLATHSLDFTVWMLCLDEPKGKRGLLAVGSFAGQLLRTVAPECTA